MGKVSLTSVRGAAIFAILKVGVQTSGKTLVEETLKMLKNYSVHIEHFDAKKSLVDNLRTANGFSYAYIELTESTERFCYSKLLRRVMSARSYAKKILNIKVDCRTYEGQPFRDMKSGTIQIGP